MFSNVAISCEMSQRSAFQTVLRNSLLRIGSFRVQHKIWGMLTTLLSFFESVSHDLRFCRKTAESVLL